METSGDASQWVDFWEFVHVARGDLEAGAVAFEGPARCFVRFRQSSLGNASGFQTHRKWGGS